MVSQLRRSCIRNTAPEPKNRSINLYETTFNFGIQVKCNLARGAPLDAIRCAQRANNHQQRAGPRNADARGSRPPQHTNLRHRPRLICYLLDVAGMVGCTTSLKKSLFWSMVQIQEAAPKSVVRNSTVLGP
jgi:hypothetical protein